MSGQSIPPELLLNALGGQLVLKKEEIRANLQGRISTLEIRLKELKGRKAQIQSQSSDTAVNTPMAGKSTPAEPDNDEDGGWIDLAGEKGEGDIGGWGEENTWATLDLAQPTGDKPAETGEDDIGGWEEENTWTTLDLAQPTGDKPAETEGEGDIGGWEEENTWATFDLAQPTGDKPAETEGEGDIGGWEEKNTWATFDLAQPTGDKPKATKKDVSPPAPVAPEVSPAPVEEDDLDDLSLDSLLGLAKNFTGDDK